MANHEPLRDWLLDLLRCPQCGTAFSQEVGCICCAYGHVYPVRNGIPRFVATDGYTASFSLEWTKHRTTQLDGPHSRESEETFAQKTGLQPADVAGKVVLEAGCGMGRFMDVVSRWGGRVVGVDLSYAVDAAQQNLGHRENVAIVQGDIFRLPFAPDAFDLVYSIGVLHHAPDCAGAFRALAPLVRPGGMLAVWVYDHNPLYQITDLYRAVTTRLPKRWLYALAHAAVPLYYVHRLPGLGKLTRPLLFTSTHPDPAWRVLDTFDWYAPTYQSKHTYPEVARWFEAAGFTDLKLFEPPVAVRGRRPFTETGGSRSDMVATVRDE